MTLRRGVLVLSLLGLATCGKGGGTRAPDGPIPDTVIPPVTFGEGSGVTQDVREECGLTTKIPEWIVEHASGARTGAEAEGGRVLSLEITQIMGGGGGAWSGPKRIVLEGTLTEGGQQIGSFRAQRTSGGGAWGGYKGTCSILEICAEELGEDVGKWMHAPTQGAKLGELE